MKRLLSWLIVGAMIGGAGYGGYNYFYAAKYGAGSQNYKTMPVRRKNVTQVVNSTGTVQPVLSVQIGAAVSGPIKEVRVDFNARVKAGQVLAELDPLIYKAQRDQAKATLDRANADLQQAESKLEQAKADWERAQNLLKITIEGKSGAAAGHTIKCISDADCDSAKAAYGTAKANVGVCKAVIEQSRAALELAETNLGYTMIKSPVDGVVIDRKVDPGQTVASQFQTPVMFIVAPDLEKKVYVYASVDEADIGLIRAAKDRGEPVTFTVDAYPKDVFEGKIAQVRLNPTTVQNVVTYTVVVEAANEQLKLLPGMTANLSFQIEKRSSVLTIPNAALRFHPKPALVRPQDLAVVEGTPSDDRTNQGNNAGVTDAKPGALAAGHSRPKYVWVAEGGLLAAVEIVTGLSDKSSTEIVSGNLAEGQELVLGTQSAAKAAAPPPPP